MKLQYDIFKVNRTKLVTIIQKFTRNTNPTTKFIDVRGCPAQPIHCGSVCRAGGKPSTGLPPGTRRAEPTFTFRRLFSLSVYINLKFQNENELSDVFSEIFDFSSFFNIFENKGRG